MKKNLFLSFALGFGIMHAQTVADFESFSLPANSFYKDTNSVDFQTTNAVFQYDWNKTYSMWSQGFSYTNKNDSTNGGFTNLYNCIAYKGYNNSNYYISAQANGVIKLKTSTDNIVNGFYIANSTYAYKSMKNGDAFAKKFGGVSGNDPDFFKVTIRGYLGGTLKSDSVEYYLADFRSSNNNLDYISRTWQWVNCSSLGVVDSVTFFMFSSDNGTWGMNTPAFFCMDNFTTSHGVGIQEFSSVSNINVYPNPANELSFISFNSESEFTGAMNIINSTGTSLHHEKLEIRSGFNQLKINFQDYSSGIYFIQLTGNTTNKTIKVIKN